MLTSLLRRHTSTDSFCVEERELMENHDSGATSLFASKMAPNTDPCPESVTMYLNECSKYGTVPNSGVLVTLRFQLHVLRPVRPFLCKDMIPLAEVLLRLCERTQHIRRVDFSLSRMRSHGAIVLSKVLPFARWESLELRHNPVGGYGASAIASALANNSTIRYVGLRGCSIGLMGTDAVAKLIVEQDTSRIESMDMSINNAGLQGALRIKTALALSKSTIKINMDNNIVLAEVLNSVTHGIGVLLTIVGAYFLLQAANLESSQHVWSAMVYVCSLIMLYTASTLYHSLYFMSKAREVLHVLDQCAIYVLIAGSYTPVLAVVLYNEPLYSTYLLSLMWIICLCGIGLTATYYGRWKGRISLCLYLVMGWTALICINDIAKVLPSQGIKWLVGGGVLYTAGVPFFALDKDPTTSMYHVIWHIFVMAGSGAHFWMILAHVMPLSVQPKLIK